MNICEPTYKRNNITILLPTAGVDVFRRVCPERLEWDPEGNRKENIKSPRVPFCQPFRYIGTANRNNNNNNNV